MVDSQLAQVKAFGWLPLAANHLFFNIFSRLSILILCGWIIANHS